jgi:hypothetical protein
MNGHCLRVSFCPARHLPFLLLVDSIAERLVRREDLLSTRGIRGTSCYQHQHTHHLDSIKHGTQTPARRPTRTSSRTPLHTRGRSLPVARRREGMPAIHNSCHLTSNAELVEIELIANSTTSPAYSSFLRKLPHTDQAPLRIDKLILITPSVPASQHDGMYEGSLCVPGCSDEQYNVQTAP